ncbi:DEAD-box ATP-dependent RNA helicase DeaD (CshA) (EC 3.6.4.13) [uncultured Gammaproteobacteria bacterium]|uniref:DEAD/DEAH box helicase n=1 Tax=Bathymodiolus heckerae thiotrophic gill symbiont TaxID=1052212 RepID=UPI0010BAF150|nr:DEAD/DEAH box helicase [Bathymodiolus heckerae thiotrophic gill symbiont]CAC9533929.1 DEAD-box ATP-dependent RNA helicase DeaD (CshA) (EC 3.6.4.13) [uncultured Gammaproteobacteria bacterium]CAC9598836.1 DEAD-box ATP-dependent RNA helicase DeaD (CshA) (EC 3.6.4.13) [uncultured Gammaproteobacteria bacterium]CAC9966154.1 DEAD-box ATP-dependent RNA helicase DeaD (CshA) (EC 3.6.4.13) [uncultured Gammaproteobacteria bacterium]SHN89445.1 Cold-shock DEAD-box protein A [Bathymodiolus heckerae thiotro
MSEQKTDASSHKKFSDLGLSDSILGVLDSIGYETPSPIQEQCITHLLNGKDIIGQAQTGTGKTAAFALPLLDNIDLNLNAPQLLILAPTRELAIQVSEAVQTYARGMKGFHVLPIYGGQSYDIQLRPLKRGVHCVVGTPGRVMDHIKKGTLKLDNIKSFVLDEADEMLKMGFIDDIKWVMERIPEQRQIALFSATMPNVIKRVAEDFLNDPKIVKVKTKTETAPSITQKYCLVGGLSQKLDALTRILEVTEFDAMIIFARTKNLTVELAEKLAARGFSAEAINGDIQQSQREKIINKFKKGGIDILVATDVAARGLDVPRISHVVNYDIPQDAETYVHRIGRTGRAGREGEAILFVSHRERRMLNNIERVTRQKIEPLELPTAKIINEKRVDTFKKRITETLSNQNLDVFEKLVTEFQEANEETSHLKIAAALAHIAQGNEPLFLSEKEPSFGRDQKPGEEKIVPVEANSLKNHPDIPMRRYKIEVGNNNNIKPGNILGAIANEADMDSEYIGSIQIFDNFSTVDLPDEMPKDTLDVLQKVVVNGKRLNMAELTEKNNKAAVGGSQGGKRNFGRKKFSKGGSRDRDGSRGGGRGGRDGGNGGGGNRKPKFSRSKPKK